MANRKPLTLVSGIVKELPSADKIAASDVSGLATVATSGLADDLSGTLAIGRLADGSVTLAKLANLAQSTIIGRAAAAGTGVPTALTAAQVSAILSLGAFATSTDLANATGILAVARIANASLTYALIQDLGGDSVMGRSAGTTGVGADIQATVDGQVLRRAGGVLGFGAIATAGVTDAAVTYAKIQNLGGDSVMGRSAGTTGVGADIQATNDGDVLRRSGSTLGFGTIVTAGIADAQITLAKMANLAQSTIIGRASGAGTGVPTALTNAQAKSILAVVQADISDMTTASNVTFATLTTTGVIASGSHYQAEAGSAFYWNGRSQIYSPSSGVIKFNDGGGTDFNRLQFGGTTSAYPSLQRSGAGFIARLADDSGDTTLRASGLTVTNNNALLVGVGAWVVSGYGHILTSQNAAYTFVLGDAGSIVRHNSASAHNFTIPPNSSVAFPVGTQIGFANIGAGNLTISRGAGVSCFASGVDTNATFGGTIFGFITKLNTDTWALTEI